MRAVIHFNPRSGRGAAALAASHLADRLAREGVEALAVPVGRPLPLDRDTVLVVVGGDGTLHHSLPAIAASRAPVYHVPFGTENLFARECGSCRDPERLARAIRRGDIAERDLFRVRSGEWSVLGAVMAGAGHDAAVLHDLARTRRGPISHASYAVPLVGRLASPAIQPVTVSVGAHTAVDARRGMVIVANSRHYAMRADPCPDADPCDGLLDTAFMEAPGAWRALAWLARARLGLHVGSPGCLHFRSPSVAIRSEYPVAVQVDGEAVHPPRGPLNLVVEVLPRAMRVLIPEPVRSPGSARLPPA